MSIILNGGTRQEELGNDILAPCKVISDLLENFMESGRFAECPRFLRVPGYFPERSNATKYVAIMPPREMYTREWLYDKDRDGYKCYRRKKSGKTDDNHMQTTEMSGIYTGLRIIPYGSGSSYADMEVYKNVEYSSTYESCIAIPSMYGKDVTVEFYCVIYKPDGLTDAGSISIGKGYGGQQGELVLLDKSTYTKNFLAWKNDNLGIIKYKYTGRFDVDTSKSAAIVPPSILFKSFSDDYFQIVDWALCIYQ